MEIKILNTYEEVSQKAKEIISLEIIRNKKLLLCAATGGSPTRAYELLAEDFIKQPQLFSELRIIKLDEWGGIPMEHPSTCEFYLQKHLIQPLKISQERYISFKSETKDPHEECKRIQNQIQKSTIDVCILGLGINGHIALNEPSEFLQPLAHVAKLSDKSLQHLMVSALKNKPTYGLTLGMAEILQSKLIIVLINGKQKRNIVKQFLSKKITNLVPASFLWLHPNVVCLIEQNAIGD